MQADGVKLTREVAETLMSALGRGGLIAEAQRLWRSMVWGRATLRPDRRSFLTAIRVFREGGALSHALHAYNGMRRAGALQRETLTCSTSQRQCSCEHIRQDCGLVMQMCGCPMQCTLPAKRG